MEFIPHLGQRIQKLRKEQGLSLQDLSERTGIWYQTLWRIERGIQKNPNIATVHAIARALHVGVDYVIGTFSEETVDSEFVTTAGR